MSNIWTKNSSSENIDISHFYTIKVKTHMAYGTSDTILKQKAKVLHMHPADYLNFMADYTLKYRTGGCTVAH
jgi:hypothetical protein